jgi:hypothetical protein
MASVNRPNSPCKNPHCGNTLFKPDFTYEGGNEDTGEGRKRADVWQCTNCSWTQPRQTRSRRTLRGMALDLYREIKAEWKETDAALDALVAAGTPSGCVLVHSSTFDYHMDKLLMLEKPRRFDVRYHSNEARANLAKAKAFVAEKQAAK